MDSEAPFSEFHSRRSRRLLPHSAPDGNGVIECHRCRERFPDLDNFWGHALLAFTVGIRSVPPPFPNLEGRGRWVTRAMFKGENSFGLYQCCRCTKARGSRTTWTSAYAYKQYGQGCKVCNDKKWVNAIFFWQNFPSPRRKKVPKGQKDYHKHLEDLCEACDLGICRYQTLVE